MEAYGESTVTVYPEYFPRWPYRFQQDNDPSIKVSLLKLFYFHVFFFFAELDRG